ncbi:MAG: helix-turn-helix transcriptional regulator [Clostridia bacterium]|nr:helix-turn-helix transcriptional regulator [Clostridia bacterium]
MESICNFIPSENGGDLKTVHFVYETEYKRLHWPRTSPIYILFLVARGTGTLTLTDFGAHPIKTGDLLLVSPGTRYEITGSDDLTYFYISFLGMRASALVSEVIPVPSEPLRTGFEELIPLWRQAISRVRSQNAHLVSEGVLLYTLSYLLDKEPQDSLFQVNDTISNVIRYVDHNYTDPSLNLKKTADIFGYTDKYLSHLFKAQTNVNWTTYLNNLRVHHATRLIDEGLQDLKSLFEACGFTDPIYFSKVFKKLTGKTPHAYIREKQLT